jgi:hypothetical protein
MIFRGNEAVLGSKYIVNDYFTAGCGVLTGRRALAGDIQVNKEALGF